MTKKEILKMIEIQRRISQDIEIANIKDYLFPDTEEFQEEINVLRKESERRRNEYSKQREELIHQSKNCNHLVRVYQDGTFDFKTEQCAICNKDIEVKSKENYQLSNDYYIRFRTQYSDNDFWCEDVKIETIYNYIEEVLIDKNDDEEVDLACELKKIAPPKCEIIDFPHKYQILVISGSNQIMIDQNYYLSTNSSGIALDLAHYFYNIPKIKLKLVSDTTTYKTNSFKALFPYQKDMEFYKYNSLEELNKILTTLSLNESFNLVIDASRLFTYELNNNMIKIINTNLNLKSFFPKSKVLGLVIVDHLSQENLLSELKSSSFSQYDTTIGYDSKGNYYEGINGNYCQSDDLNQVSDNIKEFVLKG